MVAFASIVSHRPLLSGRRGGQPAFGEHPLDQRERSRVELEDGEQRYRQCPQGQDLLRPE